MLETFDLDAVFRAARSRGWVECEIYLEHTQQMQVCALGRTEQTSFLESAGLCLFLSDGKRQEFRMSSQPKPEILFDLLDGTSDTKQSVIAPSEPAWPEELLERVCQHLTRIHRQPIEESFFVAQKKKFEVAREGTLASDSEESVSLKTRFQSTHGERAGSQLRQFAETVLTLENPFFEEIEFCKIKDNRWPAPKGEIPVVWSSKAFAKLGLLFARGFEADLVHDELSFLKRLPESLEFAFRMEERPPLKFDHAGSPTQSLLFFDGNRACALAANRKLAEQMVVPNTGHCRRESYRSLPTVGLWDPIFAPVDGKYVGTSWPSLGLYVGDFCVLGFHPTTAEITLELDQAQLLHQGERGEATEPILLKTNLLTLLSSIRTLIGLPETNAITVDKQKQHFITQIHTPTAVSPALFVPGTVPPSQYW